MVLCMSIDLDIDLHSLLHFVVAWVVDQEDKAILSFKVVAIPTTTKNTPFPHIEL